MQPAPRVAVAASGGLDSSALLHATCRQAAPLGVEVLALHVHHNLQPQADDWLARVQAQAQAWGARFVAQRLPGAPARGESAEAWAREQRYRALAAMAQAQGCSRVLLAHHRRDQAETFLLQALRAAGPEGLSGMPKDVQRLGVHWHRPWLAQPRETIEAYAAAHGLDTVADPSNTEGDLARARLRRLAWPALSQAFPQVEATLAAAASHAQQAAAVLQEVAAADLAQAADGAGLQIAQLLTLSPARRTLLLRTWMRQRLGLPPPQALLRRLPARWPLQGAMQWPTGVPSHPVLRAYRGLLTLDGGVPPRAHPEVDGPVLDLSQPGLHAAPGWRGHFRVDAVPEGGLPVALLHGVRVHARGQGPAVADTDRFALAPRASARSLKKQFQALGVPPWLRDGPCVRSADGALLFVAGLGMNALHRAEPGGPQRALHWVSGEAPP